MSGEQKVSGVFKGASKEQHAVQCDENGLSYEAKSKIIEAANRSRREPAANDAAEAMVTATYG